MHHLLPQSTQWNPVHGSQGLPREALWAPSHGTHGGDNPMSYYRRANVEGGTYFFTVVTYRRRPWLTDNDARQSLRQGIALARRSHPFEIDAWVLLPDHLHCVWTLPPGDANFAVRWAIIKRHVTHCCGARLHRDDWMSASKNRRHEATLWQRRYWEHQIRNEADFRRHIDYLHWNPVKHGYVDEVAQWPYSTFHRHVRDGVYPMSWGGSQIEGDGAIFGE